jgi:NAD(P)H-hydrate epimerase
MDMIGAPALAGGAALRMGSGLVQIAMPGAVLASALSIFPELIGLSLDDSSAATKKLLDAADKADVLALGPGLGQSRATGQRLDALFRLKKPMVVDADALNYLASLKKWPADFAANAVLTPHPGEMRRLGKVIGRDNVPEDEPGRLRLAGEAAKAFGQVIVFKGHHTVVTDAKKFFINHTGDSSLSKGGAGDVLSGMLASLIGQGMDPFEAACAAVHYHGKAGEFAGKRLGRRCVLARDVVEAIASVIPG